MTPASISIRDVNKSFGQTHAVRGLDLDVPAGSLCGFLGPNGAGKSTTIRMIMSIIYPDNGTIEVLGGRAIDSKDRIGYLPEERGVYRKMRVGDFVEYIARLKGVDAGPAARRTREWLDRVELGDVHRKKCEELSKGMQQKVQFIAAVVHEPDLLILDEPFSGLDPVNAALLNRLIREIHDRGTTIIFSTHVLHQAEQICDRIFLINHGVKLLDATLGEIRAQFDPRTVVVETMNGESRDALAALSGVTEVTRAAEGGYELTLEEQADPRAVMRTIMQSPLDVRRIELRRTTLEEVFVDLVMQDEGAVAAQKAREGFRHVQ